MSNDYDPIAHMSSMIAVTREIMSYHKTLEILSRNRAIYLHNKGISYKQALEEITLHAGFVANLETTLKMQHGILKQLQNKSDD